MTNIFNDSIEGVKALKSEIDKTEKSILELIGNVKKANDSLKFDKSGDVKKLEENLKSVTAAEKQLVETTKLKLKQDKLLLDLQIKQEKELERLIKLDEKQAKIKKKAKKLTDEEIKDKIKLQKANARRKKALEAELILEEKSINTRNELRDTIKALRIEADKLDIGSDALKRANDEIDELDAKLKDVSDSFVQNKINIGNYKEATIDLTDSFNDQKKRLSILTETYKDALAQGKKDSKQAKELKKELDKQADSLKEVEENTKKSSKAFNGMGTTLKALGIGAVLVVLSKLADLFGTSRKATLESEKAMAIFTETINVFFKSLVESWGGFKTILVSLKESTQSFFMSFEKGWLNLLISIEKGKGVFSNTEKEVARLESQLAVLNKNQKELAESTNTVANGYNSIVDAFSNTVTTTEKAIDFQQKYLQLQLDTKIQIEAQTRALAGLQEKRQILQDISDDDTLGFETRALAVKKSQEAAIEFAAKEEKLARLKETLTIQAIKGELLKSKVISESELKAITTGEQLNELLKDKNKALAISDENESAFTEAFVERVEKQTEALSFARDQEEKNRKTFRDSYEQRLDIIEEFGELQFAKNEELLNSDKNSQEERAKLFAKNQKLSDDLFVRGVELTIEQSKKSIDLNKDLTDSEKDIAKTKLDNINLNEIINAQSEEARFELIRALDLGEIEEKRLKETFKIKFEQNNSLIAQQEILIESDRTSLELKKEIALQEIALNGTTNKKLEDLEKNRIDLEKENLRARIELLKKDSIERLNLEKELNDLMLSEKEKDLEKQKELDEERKSKEKEILEAGTKLVEDQIEKQNKARLSAIDEEIKDTEDQQSKLEELAANGNKKAAESLAIAQKKEIELREERDKELERQKLQELSIAAVKSYSQTGDVGKTLTDLALLMEGVKILSAFDGIDDTGTGGNVDNKGGFYMIGHPREQMWSYENRKEVADPKTGKLRNRKELIDIVKMHDFGHKLSKKETIVLKEKQSSFNQLIELKKLYENQLQANNELIRAVKGNKPFANNNKDVVSAINSLKINNKITTSING